VVGSGVIAVAAVVVAVYARLFWLFHRHLPDRTKWRGLLPKHVVGVGIAHLMLVVASMHELSGKIHDGITWRPFVYIPAYLLGLWALWDVLGHERARMHHLAPPPNPDTLETYPQ
jgi:hypothetical protein